MEPLGSCRFCMARLRNPGLLGWLSLHEGFHPLFMKWSIHTKHHLCPISTQCTVRHVKKNRTILQRSKTIDFNYPCPFQLVVLRIFSCYSSSMWWKAKLHVLCLTHLRCDLFSWLVLSKKVSKHSSCKSPHSHLQVLA